jgi:hypothetical protein
MNSKPILVSPITNRAPDSSKIIYVRGILTKDMEVYVAGVRVGVLNAEDPDMPGPYIGNVYEKA